LRDQLGKTPSTGEVLTGKARESIIENTKTIAMIVTKITKKRGRTRKERDQLRVGKGS